MDEKLTTNKPEKKKRKENRESQGRRKKRNRQIEGRNLSTQCGVAVPL